MFQNRKYAADQLAKSLKNLRKKGTIILGLARGGVVLAHEISRKTHIPFSILIVRKLGAPENPEYGIGAISEESVQIINKKVVNNLHISEEQLREVQKKEEKEIKRRIALYRDNKPLPDLSGKRVIIVDDGLATGVTARAAIQTVKKHNPREIIFAAPVCAAQSIRLFLKSIDEVICLEIPSNLQSVGSVYNDFHQVSDDEVQRILHDKNVASI